MASHRSALVAAIREAPQDDDPRLVCADWFEDLGDEVSTGRAEFIRTQLMISRLALNDPRQVELHARELRLLKKYGPQWCGCHFLFRRARFRRGFIEYIHVNLNHYLHHRRQIAELEPVRDISLTGWHRANDDLINRIANCAELSQIEQLRIHHQGPHKHPRRNVLNLLESPHLSGLKGIELPLVEFSVEDRVHFERLPVLGKIEKLVLPSLMTWPESAGEWFADGGEAPDSWRNIRNLSFGMPGADRGMIERMLSTSWWGRLESLDLKCSWNDDQSLIALTEQLPESLRTLRVVGTDFERSSRAAISDFISYVSGLELEWLGLNQLPVRASHLTNLLESMANLKALSLCGAELDSKHIRALAEGSASEQLYHLDVSTNRGLGPDEATVLFSSDKLSSVVDLDISKTSIGPKGMQALARSEGWKQLRVLNIADSNLNSSNLEELFSSPAVENVVWATLGSAPNWDTPEPPVLSTELAKTLSTLPNLAAAVVKQNGPRSENACEEILSSSPTLAWPIVNWYEDYDTYYQQLSTSRFPPLDDAIERHWYDLTY